MSKLGKALGFSMDANDSAYSHKRGLNEPDITSEIGGSGEESKFRDPIGKMGDSDSDASVSGDDEGPSSEGSESKAPMTAETLAMKQFQKASTPEQMAEALKGFLEACGAISGDDGGSGGMPGGMY